ncbi:MerR family transcriptional regulator [Bacillus testis]|uniref:MerR family transcriptional regulator n=1 Tax=Bacillus testis TaxID=1622072 RepID=UPI00067F6ACE|nr:MerR family transcriptional regulator [Bacillus testis]
MLYPKQHVTVSGGDSIGIGRIRIGELAQMTNVSKRTIDYYTNIGLLTAERTPSNYRYYTNEAVQTLNTIKELKNKNMSLEEIKRKFNEEANNDIDLGELKHKLQGLEKNVLEIVELLQEKKINKNDLIRKQLSHESFTLIQALLILLM